MFFKSRNYQFRLFVYLPQCIILVGYVPKWIMPYINTSIELGKISR